MPTFKSVSDSKIAALQKFTNYELPKERIRAIGVSMGNQLTRNDLLNIKAEYDAMFVDQTITKISFANAITLSPPGLLFGDGLRAEYRVMDKKTPVNPTSVAKKGGRAGEVSTEEYDPLLQPRFLSFCAKGGKDSDFQCTYSYGDSQSQLLFSVIRYIWLIQGLHCG